MSKNTQLYPIILTKATVGYTVEIPDVNHTVTQGDNLTDALWMAHDAIYTMLNDVPTNEYPNGSPLASLQVIPGQTKVLITMNMPWWAQQVHLIDQLQHVMQQDYHMGAEAAYQASKWYVIEHPRVVTDGGDVQKMGKIIQNN